MRQEVHPQEEVSGRGACGARLSLTSQADHRALSQSKGNMHGARFLASNYPRTVAHRAHATLSRTSARALRAAFRHLQCQRQIRLDVGASHHKVPARAWASKSAEASLEEVAEPAAAPSSADEILEVARFRLHPLPARRRRKVRTCLPTGAKLVIALPLLGVR